MQYVFRIERDINGARLWENVVLKMSHVSVAISRPGNITWLHFPKAGTSFLATIWNYACSRRPGPNHPTSRHLQPGWCVQFTESTKKTWVVVVDMAGWRGWGHPQIIVGMVAARMALDLAVSPRAVPGCEQCYDVALMDRYPPDDYCEDVAQGKTEGSCE